MASSSAGAARVLPLNPEETDALLLKFTALLRSLEGLAGRPPADPATATAAAAAAAVFDLATKMLDGALELSQHVALLPAGCEQIDLQMIHAVCNALLWALSSAGWAVPEEHGARAAYAGCVGALVRLLELGMENRAIDLVVDHGSMLHVELQALVSAASAAVGFARGAACGVGDDGGPLPPCVALLPTATDFCNFVCLRLISSMESGHQIPALGDPMIMAASAAATRLVHAVAALPQPWRRRLIPAGEDLAEGKGVNLGLGLASLLGAVIRIQGCMWDATPQGALLPEAPLMTSCLKACGLFPLLSDAVSAVLLGVATASRALMQAMEGGSTGEEKVCKELGQALRLLLGTCPQAGILLAFEIRDALLEVMERLLAGPSTERGDGGACVADLAAFYARWRRSLDEPRAAYLLLFLLHGGLLRVLVGLAFKSRASAKAQLPDLMRLLEAACCAAAVLDEPGPQAAWARAAPDDPSQARQKVEGLLPAVDEAAGRAVGRWARAHPELALERHRALMCRGAACGNLACTTVAAPGAPGAQGKRCDGCKAVRYCGRDCQAQAWPEHRRVCKALPAEAAEQQAKYLVTAAERGHLEVVRALLDTAKTPPDVTVGAPRGGAALYMAAQHGHAEVARLLVGAGAEVDRVQPGADSTALMIAACNGHLECLLALLDAGGDPSFVDPTDGTTPVLLAAQHGRIAALKALLGAGVDADAPKFDGVRPVYMAAQNGHAEAVSLLLAAGASPGRPCRERGVTPLYIAAQMGHEAVVRLLLKAGVKADAPGTSASARALCAACHHGHAGVVAALLEAGARPHWKRGADVVPPVLEAAQAGHLATLRLLLAHGADPDERQSKNHPTPLYMAAQGGFLEAVDALLGAGARADRACSGTPPLHVVAEHGHVAVARRLLAAGAAPDAVDANGETALFVAAQSGQAELVQALLGGGAAVDRRNRAELVTALTMATAQGHADVMRALLEAGADVNTLSGRNGVTPLLMCAQRGRAPLVGLLLRAGADPARVERSVGRTPLAAAAQSGHLEVVQELLAGGADPAGQRDRNGRTPLQLAQLGGHAAVAQVLAEALAQSSSRGDG